MNKNIVVILGSTDEDSFCASIAKEYVDAASKAGNCSGLMIPDTNIGGKLATIEEVSNEQETTNFLS